MAGEYDKFKGSNDAVQKVTWVWDFAKNPKVATNVLEAIYIPAGAVVLSTYFECLEPEGATCTADIGHTGGDVDGFDGTVNLNSAAGPVVGDGALQAIGGIAYAAEDTIDILLGHDTDAAKIRLTAMMIVPV